MSSDKPLEPHFLL